jgi:CheY-like chemotaxis protein
LAIVRHLIEIHGGTVRAESEGEGRGATFTIDLPIMAAHSVEQNSKQLPQPIAEALPVDCPPTLDAVRILIVDDEADARLLLKTIVEQCGAKVLAVGSVSEALEALVRFKPHLLLSDIGMPEEDGYALIRKVRSLSPEEGGQIPAVALTAYAREEDRRRALVAGFQVHLAKPVNPAELIAVVGGLAGIRGRK